MTRQTNKSASSELYYLANGFVGNDFLFWRKGSCGYTTNIDDAEVFTKERAYRQHEIREEDTPVKKNIADLIAHKAVSINAYNKHKEGQLCAE